MRKKYLAGLLLGFLVISPLLQAQDTQQLEYRKWRFTLFPPLSTNGVNANQYTAKYSINLIGGIHGGLDGREFGLLFNVNKQYARGFQLVGGLNYSGGEMEGMNIAGLANMAKDDISGMQIAGFANIAGDDLEGMQIAGVLNFSKGNTSGLQAAGIGNASMYDIEGLQAASIFNFAGGDISGLQASGLFNIAQGDVEGLQASGLLNYSGGDISGLMATGGINYAHRIEGLTAAGLANISKESEGLQAATFNISDEAVGLQFGLINYAKEFEGMPIGVISYYGNGRKNIDVRYSDAGFTDIALTTGTYRVYNMAMIGYNTNFDRDVYRIGFGIGMEKNIQDIFEKVESNTVFVNQEFSVHHMWEGDWDKTLNRIYSYKYMIGKRFGNGVSLYGGPTFNMQVTRVNAASDYTWYSVWSPSRKGRDYRFWVGFTVGMRVFKQKNLPLMENDWDGWGEDWD